MKSIRFEWDPRKAETNERKHSVTFDEATSVFLDEFALNMSDVEHSDEEDRYLLIGASHALRVLIVCHVFRERDATIRIISARRATRLERTQYERGR